MTQTAENGLSNTRLELTNVESTLKRLLLDVARHINPSKPSQLRFTGGWVRDKLLGVGSHDIDVAINDMTGYHFGSKMKRYLEQPGNPEKYGLQGIAESLDSNGLLDRSKVVLGLHKIEANPEKSKHLETVTTKIFGLDIDLVNLRKETYTDDSRFPEMEFGTPEEDALRRDATVNAMFYNLQTDEIEDYTGHGRSDMKKRIIRTPLDPYQTFKDDPLRVLRLIRFASRLDYTIDPACKESMRDQSIKNTLKVKISRERVGVEMEKMLQGPNPHMALSLIDELGLYTTIFSDPTAPTEHLFVPETTSWSSAYDCAERILNIQSPTRETLIIDTNDEFITWLLSSFTPFADAPTPEQVKGKTPPPLASVVAREGIKATNKVSDVVASSIQNFEEIIATKDKFTRRRNLAHKDADPAGRDVLGMAIRRWGPTWRNQAIFSLLVDHTRSTRDVIPEWNTFLDHLRSLEILNAFEFKPVLDGKTLAKALNARPGPWMKEALDVVMAWQLLHPDDANQDDALQAVTDHLQIDTLSKSQGELVADLIHHFLTLTIRPLFAKTAQAHADTITAQGRKVERAKKGGPMPRKYDEIEDESVTRPWKNAKDSHALDLLKWTVNHLDPTLTERNWPLLIPPILTLLDDIDTKYKARGCEFLSGLLQATPPPLLKRTGLADVFEDALKPSLSYLPTLTPEAESAHILNAAYPALFALTSLRHSPPPHSAQPSPPEPLSASSLALINLLHTHIFPSLTHISPPTTYPTLTAVLLTHLSTAIARLGIDTVAQLIHLIPLLNGILAAPFATTTPAGLRMLTQAVSTLQLVVANAWPRMLYWRGEVLAGVVDAWVALAEEEQSADAGRRDEQVDQLVDEARVALRVCATMVLRAVEAVAAAGVGDVEGEDDGGADNAGEGEKVVDFRGELRELVGTDPRLQGLFGPLLVDGEEQEVEESS